MQVIGFNLTKIKAEKPAGFKAADTKIETNIEFINVEKANLPADVIKDLEPIKFEFKFSYLFVPKSEESEEKAKTKDKNKEDKNSPKAEVGFQGDIILSSTKEEAKDIMKSWKKKKVPNSVQVPLINFVIRKCSIKAVQLQEELGLPQHNLRVPMIKPQNQENQ